LDPTYVLALIAAAGALTVFWALRPALFPGLLPTAVDERILYYGTDVSQTDDVVTKTFQERMIQPNLDRLAELMERLTPQDYTRRLEARLEAAGRPSGLQAGGFIVLRAAAAGLSTESVTAAAEGALVHEAALFRESIVADIQALRVSCLEPWRAVSGQAFRSSLAKVTAAL